MLDLNADQWLPELSSCQKTTAVLNIVSVGLGLKNNMPRVCKQTLLVIKTGIFFSFVDPKPT